MSDQQIQLELGLPVIQSYKRLSYTPWHAIAELVDNATQSYFDNRAVLDEVFESEEEKLFVGIVYEPRDGGLLRVSDNAMGMSFEELTNALRVGLPPQDTSGRSKYGMGLKTASCWIGNNWTVRTKRLGETIEHSVTIDVDEIASGNNDLNYYANPNQSVDAHYTVIEVKNHNKVFQGRTLGKIGRFLRSMYRQDLRQGLVTIEWRANVLEWNDSIFEFLRAPDGTEYRKDFSFEVQTKKIHGWVGVLNRGSRENAGFSILHANRVIWGWPESWRPEEIYGAARNDLINQRLVGEIHLSDFEVSHTKDDILWHGGDQEQVEKLLKKACADYINVARKHRGGDPDSRGPSDVEIATAIDELETELGSKELSDAITLVVVPPPEIVTQSQEQLKRTAHHRKPNFHAGFDAHDLEILGFLVNDSSDNDPYVVVEATADSRIQIIINTRHPHWGLLSGSEGVLNYLRHCTYDGIAEWQARRKQASLDPDTIKNLKDRLLRVSLSIEMQESD